MKQLKIVGLVAVLGLLVAACGTTAATTTTAGATPTTAAPGTTAAPATTAAPGTTAAAGALSEFGETIDADPALVEKALGTVEPSDEASWNIVLASIARANQDLDQATIDKAMECWSNQECDTGTGGDVVMGYADGGGNDVNVWRSVSHMEAILQALTYPEIGAIVSTAANFDADPAVHVNGIRFLIQRGVDFIVGYPDFGVALRDVILEAQAAGISYTSFSAGWVGLPDQEGALVPGTDYLTVVGEDLCALGQSFAGILNTGVGTGKVAMLGGTPNNALSLGWQRCTVTTLADGVELVNPPANENTTTGDTIWWDVRPSARFPTLEMRITDVCTRVADAVTVAAVYASVLHMLYRLRVSNQRWRQYAPMLISENIWRAQRYGIEGSLMDFGKGVLVPYAELVEELIEVLRPDAEELGCIEELERARTIVANGTSADRQIRIYQEALTDGASNEEALRAVVDYLIEDTQYGV